MIGPPGCRNDCAISPWGMRSSFRWSRPWASGSAHWPRTNSAVDGRFSWVSKGAAAPLWHTTLLAKSSVLHLVRGVQAPGTHVRSDYSQTRHIGGRPSSHKANLIPQSKRQDTTIIVIPCLCSFTVPSSPSAKPPINKKRTRTLFRKESGSSTNCMVEN